ncbi:MAG: hypothetical protein J5929_09495 [Eubacterium sp.]|nr:hypothetical protein [Eubacterium sp.]
MSKPRSPDEDRRSNERKKAEKMYLSAKGDVKLVDIAKKLGVPDGKVRKWKSLDGWEDKLQDQLQNPGKKKQVERSTSLKGERSTNKGSVPSKRKGGAPKGSKNALGNRGNPLPVMPLKHGGYSKQYWAGLDEEEQRILDEINEDPILLLTESIKLLTVREYRIRRAIEQYREEPLYVAGTTIQKTQRKFRDDEEKADYERRVQEKIDKGDRLPGEPEQIQTVTQSTIDLRIRLQRELTSVTNQKTKALEALANMQKDKEGGSQDTEAIKIWAEKIKIMRKSKEGDKDD